MSCWKGCLLVFDGIVASLTALLLYCCGLSDAAIIAGGLIATPIWISIYLHEKKKELDSQKTQNDEMSCHFDEGISQDEFAAIARKVSRRIRRLSVLVDGAKVCGEVESQSGTSTWTFIVDFNDGGSITGKWKIEALGNKDSSIPQRFAEQMEREIQYILKK